MISNRPLRVVSLRSTVRPLRWSLFPLLALAAVAQAGLSPVPSYTLTDLGTLPGNLTSEANALNDRGEVVGSSGSDAFLYSGGRMIDLTPSSSIPPTPTPLSFAAAINDSGQVVGTSHQMSGAGGFLYSGGTLQPLGVGWPTAINATGQIAGNAELGFTGNYYAMLISGGTTQNLGTLGGGGSYANAMNAAGQVVGQSYLPPDSNSVSAYHPFLHTNGRMIDLGTLEGNGAATGINDHGQIVGDFNIDLTDPNPTRTHAFLYSGGTMHDLGANLSALGINDSGQIVGFSYSSGAFVDVNGTLFDLNSLIPSSSGYVLQSANAINASGQIAANALTPDGQQHAVLLTPTAVPLPAAALAALPLVPLLWLVTRPRRNRTRHTA